MIVDFSSFSTLPSFIIVASDLTIEQTRLNSWPTRPVR